MQKYLSIPLALLLLASAGCRERQDHPEESRTVHLRLEVSPRSLAQEGRAITDLQRDGVAGVEPEDRIIDGQLYIGDLGLSASRDFERKGESNRWTARFDAELKESDTKRRVAAVINSQRLGLRGADYSAESTVTLDDLERMIGRSFLMSSTFDDPRVNLHTITPSPDRCTSLHFDVERIVSKAQLRRTTTLDLTKMSAKYGTIDPDLLTWTIAGSARSAYLFGDHAGARLMGKDGLYKGLKTSSATQEEGKPYDLAKVSHCDLYSRPHKVSTSGDGSDRIYFLEHALKETNGQAYPKEVTYANVVYAKIYATLRPTHGYRIAPEKGLIYATEEEARRGKAPRGHLDDSLLAPLGTEQPGDRWYWIDAEEPLDSPSSGDREPSERRPILVHDASGTFYYGLDDHEIYDTLLAARAGGNSRIRKFTDGRMVYLTPLNEQRTEKGIFNCDTRRNTIYDLVLRSISGLGYNYDPVDPGDPNIPAPKGNPWEPRTEVPPINGRANVIRLTATPRPWQTILHTVVLKSNH